MGELPSIYLISDRCLHAPGHDFLTTLEALLKAGLRMVQLREKDLSAAQLYPLALQVRQMTQRYDARLLINDRLDLALAVAADGVHLGGHSLPVASVRRLAPTPFLIGVSTHSVAAARNAARDGADFVTYGPVFHTASKAQYGSPVGPEGLETLTREGIQTYALGGVNIDNIEQIVASGGERIAAISTLLQAQNPAVTFEALAASLSSSRTIGSE